MAPFKQVRVPAHLRDPRMRGQPTKYRPEYCGLLIEATHREGISLTAFAGLIRVGRETVYGWISAHSEFSDAAARAKAIRALYLERKLLRSRKGAETTAAVFALKNACPDEWRDVRHTEHTHAISPRMLTDQQLEAIAAGISPSDAGVIDGSSTRIGEK
jgi:hypothetical protein